jgi:3-oxoacyl-(acyl-carrier-protein) synthase
MLAGAVNRTDDLLIRAGFCALGALSRTGRSRPFHREADGLVPAEGVALVLLRRLEDAVAAGDPIYGVIRGIGLSNDGRRGGFLSPSPPGQEAALRRAYRQAGLAPGDISLVECHATGTLTGDRAELETLQRVFAGCADVPLGSLKSNLGHLITAAGAAGLLKVLAAFAAGIRPPTLHADESLEEVCPPFRLLRRAEPWTCSGPRRAALNAFGFGGTNAHVIVEQWQPGSAGAAAPVPRPRTVPPVAVVALAVRAGGLDTEGFADRLFRGAPLEGPPPRRMREVVLDARTTAFPPRDLEKALPQQLAVLEVVQEATRLLRLPAEATAVLVGMQCDAEVARQGVRIRLPDWASAGAGLPAGWLAQARDAVAAPLESATVVGQMPNIPANRVNVLLDFRGPGFTVAGEELSGLYALDIAARWLQAGELDAAVVAAVDLCCEPVHAQAAAEVLPAGRREPGDAAVALVLKRLADARREGDPVLAVVEEGLPGEDAPLSLRLDEESTGLTDLFGHAHAASGLLLAAAAALSVQRGSLPTLAGDGPRPWNAEGRHARVSVAALGGQRMTFTLREAPQADAAVRPIPSRASAPAGLPLCFPAHPPDVVFPALPAAGWNGHSERPAGKAAASERPVGEETRPKGWLRTLEQLAGDQGRVFQDYLRNANAGQMDYLALRDRALLLVLRGQSAVTAAPLPAAPENGPLPGKASGAPRGPSFGWEALLELSQGKVSSVFGRLFEQQDGYHRQVRLPTPPLLLVDRITGIDAPPGVKGPGTIWTETDVRWGQWYLHDGVMVAGVMIEAGQADLTLISYMGADFENRGERVYRLLGCDLTYHGGLPRPGETLCYDIHVTGHARQGDVRLFFFRYDCRVNGELRMTVRNGQAGFFTDQELAESSGILWSPLAAEPRSDARLDPPRLPCLPTSFDRGRVCVSRYS